MGSEQQFTDGRVKPFLKWVGGKTQLLDSIHKTLPHALLTEKEFTYVEPFIGGGAVLFSILMTYPSIQKAVINDINSDLINTYRIVKKHPEQLIKKLRCFQEKFLGLSGIDNQKAFFYEQRDLFNARTTDKVMQAALFIFLNKTCFNGL